MKYFCDEIWNKSVFLWPIRNISFSNTSSKYSNCKHMHKDAFHTLHLGDEESFVEEKILVLIPKNKLLIFLNFKISVLQPFNQQFQKLTLVLASLPFSSYKFTKLEHRSSPNLQQHTLLSLAVWKIITIYCKSKIKAVYVGILYICYCIGSFFYFDLYYIAFFHAKFKT